MLIIATLGSFLFVIHGGPAKVKSTYIFALVLECIDKIQCFLANVITV